MDMKSVKPYGMKTDSPSPDKRTAQSSNKTPNTPTSNNSTPSQSSPNSTMNPSSNPSPVAQRSMASTPSTSSTPPATGNQTQAPQQPTNLGIDTTQFRQGTSTPPLTQPRMTTPQVPIQTPATPNNAMLQIPGQILDRVAGQLASFFLWNKKDVVDEEFAERWEKNELSSDDLFDQNKTVQDTAQTNLGGGNQ